MFITAIMLAAAAPAAPPPQTKEAICAQAHDLWASSQALRQRIHRGHFDIVIEAIPNLPVTPATIAAYRKAQDDRDAAVKQAMRQGDMLLLIMKREGCTLPSRPFDIVGP